MKFILLVLFLITGEPQPRVISQEVPDMKSCERQAHVINSGEIPKEIKGHSISGIGAACFRILPGRPA